MVTYPNRFFKGWCSNEGNPRSHILHYHIDTVRDITDYAGGTIPENVETLEEYFDFDLMAKSESYYVVSATFKFNIPRGPIKVFETLDLKVAVFIVEQLSGNKVVENEIYG
jgi:hypothetical protein